jgi:hypothetical protein
MAAEHILHMQKALSQMNLQLHHVLSDITGTSGQAILPQASAFRIHAIGRRWRNWLAFHRICKDRPAAGI